MGFGEQGNMVKTLEARELKKDKTGNTETKAVFLIF